MLRWHYRSRHESLVTVSNHEFYEDRLVIFPSPERNGRNAGLVYHYLLDTVYDRGGSRSNPGEARMVAQAVMETLSPLSKPEEIAETVARATLAIADARSVARFWDAEQLTLLSQSPSGLGYALSIALSNALASIDT